MVLPSVDDLLTGPIRPNVLMSPNGLLSDFGVGQMRKSPFSFSSIGDTSPLLWLARRYAILDGPTMPIVAEGDEEPNNTYVEQLTASARAAVQARPALKSTLLCP